MSRGRQGGQGEEEGTVVRWLVWWRPLCLAAPAGPGAPRSEPAKPS